MIRINQGKEFALVPTTPTQEEVEQGAPKEPIQIFDRMGNLIKEIKADLSIGEYEVDVESVSEIPRTRAQIAQLTQQLAQAGVFGDPNSLEVKDKVLTDLDYPGRRGIIEELREQQEKMAAQEQPGAYIEIPRHGVRL